MPLLQVLKSALAIVIAWAIADAVIPGPEPIFAAVAALVVVAPSVHQSLAKEVERSAGVVAGVAIASVIGLVLGADTWVALCECR